MLDAVEEALDPVSRLVCTAVVLPGRDTVGARRDDRLRTGCFDTHDQSVGVVSFVGNQGGARHIGDQIVRTIDVGDLSRAQNHAQRFAQGVDGKVQLGRQTSTRAPQRLRSYFFWVLRVIWGK